MADGGNEAATMTVSTPAQMVAPQTATASHFALSMTVNEILLGVGHSRFVMAPGPGGAAVPAIAPEFFLALSLSPSSVVQLADILTRTVAAYEERFGPIPRDAGAQLNVKGPGTEQRE